MSFIAKFAGYMAIGAWAAVVVCLLANIPKDKWTYSWAIICTSVWVITLTIQSWRRS